MKTYAPLLVSLVVSLSACGRTIPDCVPIVDDVVSDGETTPVGSADDFLATVETEQELAGTWWDGAPASAQVSVARGTGSARWVETEARSRTTFGGGVADILVECSNYLEVPLEVAVVSDDGALVVQMLSEGLVREASFAPEEGLLNVAGAYLGQRIPAGDEDPSVHGRRYTYGRLHYDAPAPELVFAEVGWGGTEETEEYVSGRAVSVLSLGADPRLEPATAVE